MHSVEESNEKQGKEALRVTILKQAYSHPRFAGMRFQTSKMCDYCGSEYVVITEDLNNRQRCICQNCGVSFQEKALVS